MGLYRYNNIKSLPLEFNTKVKPHLPSPADGDYKKGYITRYFAQKTNDSSSKIIEIDSKTYTNLKSNSFYSVVDLLWVISGKIEDVREKNKKSLLFSAKELKKLPTYLNNLTQFYKK